MKKQAKLLSITALVLSILFATANVMAAEVSKGSAAALADDSYTLEEMLTYAIQDEYAAQAEYAKIISVYGSVKPYKNIVKAEEKHISALLPLFEASGFAVPVNDAAADVVLPDSLKASYQVGVDAEIMNIDMYQRFLAEDLPQNVRTVFESLMLASESHLAAFERAVGR
ncbi:hypothetical protein LNN31_17900 [Acetobacterium wieringae]|jgi:hypothetical protein|uniref:DUF2202 domain-containing protein n=1 Tax=Acetobacterium wieringae TaxID=52694 RepID=A0A5D0WIV9_9FIRM|nr:MULTISPECIES: hypothetical protein [Acetobacterium]MEA4806739.1 hypothetical protein [Acetobacterium wieringae]OXS26717.1 MAG: hypothetical protein BI182_03145 [Acetobacterium sp. MES1]TYC83651.1 hypothetical protein FXB42_15470 [Acetobacterium wieringae]URN84242.1 hypothetical protein CHL1_003426 [Acetobacterium wieringae]UYO62631.1 hypothetical protein LNN31_17900 [Acetobacterium wieringae]